MPPHWPYSATGAPPAVGAALGAVEWTVVPGVDTGVVAGVV